MCAVTREAPLVSTEVDSTEVDSTEIEGIEHQPELVAEPVRQQGVDEVGLPITCRSPPPTCCIVKTDAAMFPWRTPPAAKASI